MLLRAWGATLLAAGVIAGAAALNYREAARFQAEGQRLTLYVTVQRPIASGTRLAAGDLSLRLGRVQLKDRRPIRDPNRAVGRYTLVSLAPGVGFARSCLSERAPGSPVAGHAVLPVQVPSEHAIGLRPGMRLAFASSSRVIPTAAELARDPAAAYPVLSVTRSERDPAISTVMISLPHGRLASAARLGTEAWRPIVVEPLPAADTSSAKQTDPVVTCPEADG